MKTLLLILSIVFLVSGCGGTTGEAGVVNTSGGGGGPPAPPPVVVKAPSQVISDFQAAGIALTCNQSACTGAPQASLDALDTYLSSFQSMAKSKEVSAIALNTSAQVTYDSVTATLTMPTTIASADVNNFLNEYAQVNQTVTLIGIPLAFPSDTFNSATLGDVLQVLKTNRTTLNQYDKQITLIDFESGQNSFSNGVWTVDRTQLQSNFSSAFAVIKSQL